MKDENAEVRLGLDIINIKYFLLILILIWKIRKFI
jgi:hypothetical protein